jgi:hypothetical protein
VQDVLVPTPIGVGPHYHPAPAVHARCTPAPLVAGRRVHIELFANGRVVIVPARIGIGHGCRAGLWTLDPTGVVRFERPARLGDLFAVWGRRLTPSRLLTFRGLVRVYRNGSRWFGDPRRLPLRDGDQLVLQVGGYVPPHARYLFPPH